MPYGYHGKILRVNLSTGETSLEGLDDRLYRTYMGGWSLIAHYLLKELRPGADPLGPENRLIFATGVVTGAPVAGAGRSQVGAKSPLTGGFGEADVGGWWGAELTQAGLDAIVITGRAEKPVYLWIKGDAAGVPVAEIRPAEHLWGMLTADTQAALRQELGEARLRVAQIGPPASTTVGQPMVYTNTSRADCQPTISSAGPSTTVGKRSPATVCVTLFSRIARPASPARCAANGS